ncbi:MAG TPA: cytochrome c [Pseudolabrys sp.]|nr:cytochrome c [Pseudolabrys sp.]
MVWRILVGVVVLVAVACGTFYAWAWRGEIPPRQKHDASSFDPSIVAKGAQLAAIASCGTCHTKPGGRPYAGGYPVKTPFGTIYGPNITPDPETGIGTWSSAAFRRAMRVGVSRDGQHLYPAFPYDHFTYATNSDIDAIYAFIMTREPVRQASRPPEIAFPLNIRLLAAAWKLLYLHRGPYRNEADKDDSWARGAYLTASLGHCGACHTPRNKLGAEEQNRAFNGGEGEGWRAPPLNENSRAPVPWTADAMFNYLRRGYDTVHGHTAGPMADVAHNMAKASANDVRAIATYVTSLSGARAGAASPESIKTAVAAARKLTAPAYGGNPAHQTTGSAAGKDSLGAKIFTGTCVTCHHSGGGLPISRPIDLGLSTPINEDDPTDLLHIILSGIHPRPGHAGRIMPGFEGALTDAQIVALVDYLRTRFSHKSQWKNVAGALAKIRQRRQTAATEAPQ